jgi:predicted Zn-ribbon and HTH transcriptional regulator
MSADKPGYFKGRHYTDWLDEVDRLERKNKQEELLSLLLSLIDATEQESQSEGWIPPRAYSYRTAGIYEDRGDFETAIAILARYRKAIEAVGKMPEPDLFALIRRIRWSMNQDPIIENSKICPSCGNTMDPPIKRSGKCKHCQHQIVARKVQDLTVLRTKEQNEEINRREEEFERSQAFMYRVNSIGVSDEEFLKTKAEMSEKFGSTAADGDVFWSLANSRLDAAARSPRSAESLAFIYRKMAEHLHSEGRDWIDTSREAVRLELKQLIFDQKTNGLRVIPCRCKNCSEVEFQDGVLRDVDLEEAKTRSEPPHSGCISPPCSCHYSGR